MRLLITATELELTEPLKLYIERRLASVGKLLERFERQGEIPLSVEIARTTEHHHKGEQVYYAEATAAVNRKTVRVKTYADDARKAVDELENMLKREVLELKEESVERRRN